ncbi:MAG: hypothetical protein Q8O72_09435 [Bacteroidales bacterium]|nr:hypothetical protein [Bacteroidales bacterium]
MKKLLFTFAFILINSSLFAQKAKTLMSINSNILEISVEKITDGYKYSFKQLNKPEQIPNYSSYSLNREVLSSFIQSAYKEINDSIPKKIIATISSNLNMAFIEIVANLFNEEMDGPVIATIKLKDAIPVFTHDTKGKDSLTRYYLTPSNCYIVFKDGFIEQIKVYGEVKEKSGPFISRAKITATQSAFVIAKNSVINAENSVHRAENIVIEKGKEMTDKKIVLVGESTTDSIEISKEIDVLERQLVTEKVKLDSANKILVEAIKSYQLLYQDQQGSNDFRIKNGEMYGFSNIFSIGISSLTNLKDLQRNKLFIDNSKSGKAGHVKLGDVIAYNSVPKQGTRDYSPANGEVELVKNQTINLHKSSNAKLLEFKVFTDAVGFGEDTPNGLVQLELEKRIPINTKRCQGFRAGHSFFSFIDFEFTQSKLENKYKYLKLNTYTTPTQDTANPYSTVYYLDALQVYRYQIFQIGSNLNFYLLESQPLKFDLELNFHANFGYSRVIDTLVSNGESVFIDSPLNSFLLGPEVKFIFYPEKRLNITLSDKLTRQYFLYDSDKFGYNSLLNNELVEGNNWFNTVGIDAYYWPSDEGKIFVRYRFNHELNNTNSNFSQFQIGYSMYIKTSKKEK